MSAPLWIVGGSGAALEVWAVYRALEAAGRAPGPLGGFVTPDGETSFDPEGLAVHAEDPFLVDAAASERPTDCVLAVGSPGLRHRLAARYAEAGARFVTLVHPSAVLGPRTTLGAGSVLMACAVIETHAVLGSHALVNVHASVAHDAVIGECVSLGPGVHLAGRARIGDRCDLGAGACTRPGVTLGSDVVVGAGAAVVGDWEGPLVLVGVPARPLPARGASR